VERALGLMCGAGVLPARVAREAKRRGFRIVAFAFGAAPGLDGAVDRLIPSTVSDITAVLAGLRAERVTAALFCGTLSAPELMRARGDAASEAIAARGGDGLSDAGVLRGVLGTLGDLGVEVLDQRPFYGDWLTGHGPIGGRDATAAERADVARGLWTARRLAEGGVGQTVVVRRGRATALEASEGTTETIRRGLALAGPGAVVVKAVAPDNDYRFDVPAVGPETVEVMAAGGATALAIETGRVLVLERAQVVAIADRAGIAVIGVPAEGGADR
jgi:UDP-2,3-diacylglucosamine hydrolase